MLLSLAALAGGLVLLVVGAEGLVRGSSSLARRLGLTPLVIGLTVVAVGTSLPELLVSISAAMQGSSALALGNVVGSNISNVALILGTAALFHSLQVQAQVVRIDAPILLGVSLLLGVLVLDAELSRLDGALLTTGIVAYVVFSVNAARSATPAVQQEFDEGVPAAKSYGASLLFLGAGLAGLVAGARLLVHGAVEVATALGISQVVIGLTVVAVGTSLPELATSIAAARRGEGDIAIGNAIGSSIFNILGILGVTVLVRPLSTDALRHVDLMVMIGLAAVLLPLMRSHFSLSRREGGVLLAVYSVYVAYVLV
jgi:cation:H+ antiporter